ncbi:MAG: YhbY family RNA-binding protein [Nanoarchaeota archaeon]|nr:YhbY family RNA-binding protein [Nanoarchaeota archaeon]
MKIISTIQVGKKGVTDNLVETLQTHFKKHINVKIVFLKSSIRDKRKLKKATEEILDKLGKNYTYRILGFTVFIKKWRKAKR